MGFLRRVSKKVIPFWMGQKLRGAYQKSLGLYYRGNQFYCPFCGYSFSKMLEDGFDLPVIIEKEIIGSGRRENCTCPRCFSKDRDRLIYLYLENKTQVFFEPNKILHIAPEAWLKEMFRKLPNIDYTCGVKEVEGMGYYYDRMTRELDITNLEMKDNLYDIVICNHVLEHIYDDDIAMSEIYRVLKPGGWAILQVPISPIIEESIEDQDVISKKGREKHFGQFDHVRIYGQDYFKRLQKVGFETQRLHPVKDNWNIANLKKYALNNKEELFIATKPL
ncbi:class I SAM-dependent methyltransferase [Lentimicrobium sp. L6]|uniref:class I SAM-dependent methyltransferase n=1 Tax=Lentimicrobium sp. L6 TaxID=2735916 RepID=UPI001555E1C2|nr:class I SAM-dependent methyltransferase [Lentimicrobium sp. L6]NPD86273.1 class I SAM-dependent methyltransferase [Lentimicrobium sp. L6]